MRASYNVIVALRNPGTLEDGTYQKEPTDVRLKGVHSGNDWNPYSGYGVILENGTAYYDLDSWEVKPYVRPLTAMTDMETEQYNKFKWHRKERYPMDSVQEMDFLLRNHFDIFNLLNRDLAIELTTENSPYEPKFKVGDEIISLFDDMESYTIKDIKNGCYYLDKEKYLQIYRQKGWKIKSEFEIRSGNSSILED